MRRIARRIIKILPEIFLVYACVCIAVRLTIRDRYFVGRLAFYAPVFMLLALTLLCAIAVIARGRRRWVVLLYIPLAAGLIFIATSEYQPRNLPKKCEGETIRVLSWNVFHGLLGWDAVLDELKRSDADIIFLTEAIGEDYSDRPGFWREHLPGYAASGDDGQTDFIILVRGRFVTPPRVDVSRGLDMVCAELEVCGRRINAILPHLTARVERNNEAIYARILAEIDNAPKDTPLIVSGDFNTPTNSLYVEEMRKHLTFAQAAAGKGFGYSWPLPFAMWALDHTFVNSSLDVVEYRLDPIMLSDHAAQRVVLRFNDAH